MSGSTGTYSEIDGVISNFVKLSAVLGTVVLAGCSETSFKDAFDMGKMAPDETQVQKNRSLTMPPDLQLRAPNGGAPQAPVANNVPPVTTQPPQYGQPQQYGNVPQQPQGQAYVPPTTQPTAPAPDIYARNGIVRLRADGSKKTDAELIAELRALKKKRQQAANPNYGTVFNLPNVWKDDG